MPDGDHWTAISELRAGHTRHERELGGIASEQVNVKKDVHDIAEEVRKARHEMRNNITASELRVTEHVDEKVDSLEDRLNRLIATGRWVITVSVPLVCVLLGLLVGRS